MQMSGTISDAHKIPLRSTCWQKKCVQEMPWWAVKMCQVDMQRMGVYLDCTDMLLSLGQQ